MENRERKIRTINVRVEERSEYDRETFPGLKII